MSLDALNGFSIDLLVALGVVYLVFGVEDLFVDLVASLRRLRPKELTKRDLAELDRLPQKPIAIVVPAWKESAIIRRMLQGNVSWLEYSNYHVFVGCYPNDPETASEVAAVSRRHPHVHAIVNRRPGPTSKGQLLNYAIGKIRLWEKANGIRFEAMLMQDAEDLIHPKVLKLVNERLGRFDFVQIPVFSLEVNPLRLVAGTYMDEFAESHTKDILVRDSLGAAIPSAGVGTALSRRLVTRLALTNGGDVFDEKILTEDYALGVRAHALGFRPHFAAAYYRVAGSRPGKTFRDYIATREYFPRKFDRSVRQKTRWTTGIALQCWRSLGWQGSPANRYFLFRDRKGIFTNPLALLGYAIATLTFGYAVLVDNGPLVAALQDHTILVLGLTNFVLMTNRIFQRMRCTVLVYGGYGALPVLLRWPLAIAINALASLEAVRKYATSLVSQRTLAWTKTEHELPAFFGETTPG